MKLFHSPSYDDPAFDTTAKAHFVAEGLDTIAPAPRPVWETLTLVHSPHYVDAVMEGAPSHLANSAGLGAWSPALRDVTTAHALGCIDAAEAAWSDGVAGTLSSGLHHASYASGAGFCTFNGLALAALTFRRLGAARVLVLDLDAHFGGGTYDILGKSPWYWAVDVATDPFDGYAPDRPTWRASLTWAPKAYLATIRDELDRALSAGVDAVIYNAGMDPHEHCLIGGQEGITAAVLAERERMVFEMTAAVPTMFTLAGGYVGPKLPLTDLVALHRLTVDAACA